MLPTATVPTRILILSDTHGLTFPSPTSPFSHPPPPAIDLLIHCGDLTRAKQQTRAAYLSALTLLAAFPASLKLVIAGNHDIALDPVEWAARGGKPKFHDEVVELMKGTEAQAGEDWKGGIVFLDEGSHEFVLANGARVRVYATPYTPLWSESAFKYPPNEDRFSLPSQIAPGTVSTAKNPVLDWPNVDIMITHGPPLGVLDMSKKGKNAGCPNLRRAVERVRPRVNCFGHVHEGYGAQVIKWESGDLRPLVGHELADEEHEGGDDSDVAPTNGGKGKSKAKKGKSNGIAKADKKGSEKANPYPAALKVASSVVFGKETVMVNAAIREKGFGGMWQEDKYPWVLELDLPVAGEAAGEAAKDAAGAVEVQAEEGKSVELDVKGLDIGKPVSEREGGEL